MRTDLFSTALQHLLIVLTICSTKVGSQALRRLIGKFDAVLQQADGQRSLQQRGRLCRQEQPEARTALEGMR